MIQRIIENARIEIPVYLDEFKVFWETTFSHYKANDEILSEIFLNVLVVKNWKLAINSLGRTDLDQILYEIHEDVNASLFLASFGFYRSAHMHLRSMIELTLQLLYFNDHPVEYQKWQKGDFVIKFDKLQDYFVGYPNFCVKIDVLMSSIFKDWKEFSKHIHAEEPKFFQTEKENRRTKNFSISDFNKWKSCYGKTVYRLNKLFLLFFVDEQSRFTESTRIVLYEKLQETDLPLFQK